MDVTELQQAARRGDLAAVSSALDDIYESVGIGTQAARAEVMRRLRMAALESGQSGAPKHRQAPHRQAPSLRDPRENSPWRRAPPRDTGTLAHLEKKRLELAGMAPSPQITWGPLSWPTPSWAPEKYAAKPHRARPATANARLGSMDPPLTAMEGTLADVPGRPPNPPPVESPFSLEDAAAEWTCNRGGGGCWMKAEVQSGTLAHMEKKRLELAARAPQPKITWSPPNWPPPKWSSTKRALSAAFRVKPSHADIKSEYGMMKSRPQLWPPLDVSSMQLADLSDLVLLLSERERLTDAGKVLPRMAHVTLDGRMHRLSQDGDGDGEAEGDGIDEGMPGNDGLALVLAQAFNAEHPAAGGGGDGVGGVGGGEDDEQQGKHEGDNTTPPLGRLGFQTLAVNASHNQLANIIELPRVLSVILVDVRSLITLDLSHNQISHLPQSMGALASLEALRLHSNALSRMDELLHLKPLVSLARLTLMNNPLVMQRLSTLALLQLKQTSPNADSSHEFYHNPHDYRLRVLARLPHLRQLDQMPVTSKERSRSKTFGVKPKYDKGEDGEFRSRPHPSDLASLKKLHRKEEKQS